MMLCTVDFVSFISAAIVRTLFPGFQSSRTVCLSRPREKTVIKA
jgi:hypothetical protein